MTNITKNINCFQLFIEYLTPFPKGPTLPTVNPFPCYFMFVLIEARR